VQQLEFLFHRCLRAWGFGALVLVVGFVIFSILEGSFFFKRIKKPWRSTRLDLQYFCLGLLYPPCISFVLSAVFAFLMIERKPATPAISPAAFAGQLPAVLFACDVLVYIRHRIFHASKPLWLFHSIHHSSEELNWTSAARFHPAENIIEATGVVLVFMTGAFMGGNPRVFLVAGLLIGFYDFMIHSNLRWTFGPLGYVLASPVQHRWHHSDDPAAMDKNFAAMFSCIDLILGTFYLPKNVRPKATGLYKEQRQSFPRNFSGQLAYPIKGAAVPAKRPAPDVARAIKSRQPAADS